MFRNRRTAVVALGAAVFGALALASPASADVTANPSEATRGDGAKVTFRLSEDRPGAYTTKVQLIAPVDNPIGEIYPMSQDDWAPATETRTLDEAVAGLHGMPVTETTASITWSRVDPKPASTPPVELTVSMGPMPSEGDELAFTLVQTYSDGTVVRWADAAGGAHPAVLVKLVGQAVPGANGHHGGGQQQQAPPPVAAAQTPADGGSSYGILAAGLVAGLGLGAVGGWLILRSRRRTTPAATAQEPAREKVGASA
ncbi:hypothetical protein GCM10022251_79220 [Phytohabitans flavus]|uniref:YncI copper-binding domain-containing protein n=1 Tax=Phytohabitans flavus TaxID=1076124 RepID=A0A6F8Y905_9ACTN|nr:DUF1775 domain-containing protein [Phytohabitans flavus]BCB82540.1 hypothetical protein Pflav_089500 [Phytohabitans flavus]